jgi:hypothetical protein
MLLFYFILFGTTLRKTINLVIPSSSSSCTCGSWSSIAFLLNGKTLFLLVKCVSLILSLEKILCYFYVSYGAM